MKKIFIVILAIIILFICGYLYVRFSVLISKNFKPDTTKSKSILDLRPQLIAKLQQMVKDGSDGLYNLLIEKIEPHVISGGMDIMNVKIAPDSLTLSKLKSSSFAPTEVFKISIDSFHIDGIGIEDILHKNQVNLKTISFTGPVIEMYHLKKLLNNEKKNDTTTSLSKINKADEKNFNK